MSEHRDFHLTAEDEKTYTDVNRSYSTRSVPIRRAPAPPLFRGDSKYLRNTISCTQHQTDFIFGNSLYPDKNLRIMELMNQLIFKEIEYLEKFRIFLKKMKKVSTQSCQKLIYLKPIENLHTENLKQFRAAINPLAISRVFLEQKDEYNFYVEFAKNRTDFSYLVMDLGEVIMDHFKNRLLEYNFILSELKTIYNHHLKIKMSFTEAEDILKNIYDKISFTIHYSEMYLGIDEETESK